MGGPSSHLYSQDATTDIDAKYVKRRGFTQRFAFLRLQKAKFNIHTPFSSKTATLGPDFDGTSKMSAEKTACNIRGAKSKRPLNVIVAP